MASRYTPRRVFDNTEEAHEHLRESRGVKKIRHFETPHFNKLTTSDHRGLTVVLHLWTTGDRFYKLSHKYYGTTKYWWVIARYNRAPTEAHVKLGQKISIPLPLDKILAIYGV
jgi:nucleoid-associated protein YgaU